MQAVFNFGKGKCIRVMHSTLPLTIRSKMTKAEVIHQLHKDNKALFGGLLEKRKERLAREKREKKAKFKSLLTIDATHKKTEITPKPQTDSEFYWMCQQNSKIRRIVTAKKISPENQILDKVEKTINESVENPVDISNVPSPRKEIENVELQNSSNDKKQVRKLDLPSDILINKMTSFSYLDGTKAVQNILDVSEPISISPYSDKSKLAIPSVTRILNQTMSDASKLNLELWKKRMILELGEEGFQKYSKELLLYGKQFHSSIQNHLTQQPFEVPTMVEKSWQSVQHVLKDISGVQAIESHVIHPKLHYRGVVDCVATYRGTLCVVDWKKSDKLKSSIENTFDAPIQVASYIGALNSDSNYNFQIQHGLVVVGYTNGDPASVHEISPASLNKYWKLWLQRLQQYYVELRKGNENQITEKVQ
ncbi:mitochondrial genome maintenance exonuclease 1-like [Athalia rosae]|uniref:mitochondrial genome maintenance exonuclease 1-like n=1 Tax=Athalia rosae TaxID=37344 RepID=UPI002033E8B3|nr:mitochondrial genome maintenance exonuclease 1-like [Athalia rosae]